jgi:hypothetical protein
MNQDQMLRTIVAMAGEQLNREIVRRLLGMVVSFPLGTEVVVRGSRYAGFRGVVTAVPEESPALPRIRLTHGPNSVALHEQIDVATADLGPVEVAAYVPPVVTNRRAQQAA